MNTKFINSKNSKTSDTHRLLLLYQILACTTIYGKI